MLNIQLKVAGKHGAYSCNKWIFSGAVTERFELGWVW